MERINIYLTQRQKWQLDLLVHHTRVPASVYIRDGIDMVLVKERVFMSRQLELPFPKGV